MKRAEGRDLSEAARLNMERLARKLDTLKRRVEVWDTDLIPLVRNLNALFEQFRETDVFREGLGVLKLLRDTEVRRKQKRATKTQKRRK